MRLQVEEKYCEHINHHHHRHVYFSLMNESKHSLIPSCGVTLLRSSKKFCDYTLRLDDGRAQVKIMCHRCVLMSHSHRLSTLMTSENYFDMRICVKPGYLSSAVELIQYMYLKDPTLLSEKGKILEICGLFHMSIDHFIISRNKLHKSNDYPITNIVMHFNHEKQGGEVLTVANDFHRNVTVTSMHPQVNGDIANTTTDVSGVFKKTESLRPKTITSTSMHPQVNGDIANTTTDVSGVFKKTESLRPKTITSTSMHPQVNGDIANTTTDVSGVFKKTESLRPKTITSTRLIEPVMIVKVKTEKTYHSVKRPMTRSMTTRSQFIFGNGMRSRRKRKLVE